MASLELASVWLLLLLPGLVQPQQADLGGLGADCDTSADCRDHALCSSSARVCVCRETYVPDKDNVTCLAGLRQKCRYDDGCVPHAYCRHQERCECKEGYIPTRDLLHCQGAAPATSAASAALLLGALLWPR